MDAGKMKAFMGTSAANAPSADPGADDLGVTDDAAVGEASGDRFADELPAFEAHAGEIMDAAEMVTEDAAAILNSEPEDLPPGAVDEAMEGFEGLEEELQTAVADAMQPDVTLEDCQGLAAHLASEGLIEDLDKVAAWFLLVRVGLQAEPSEEDEEDLDEEDADDGDLEDALAPDDEG